MKMLEGTRIIVLDIETTGFSFKNDHIIELGVIEFLSGEETRRNSSLFGGGSSPPACLKVHGIPDADRVGKPTFASKASSVKSYLQNAILMGHNIKKFDLPFIQAVLEANGFKVEGNIQLIDTLNLARKHITAPNYKLETLCKVYGIEHGNHRGLGDSESTWKVFLKIVEDADCSSLNEVTEGA